MSPHPTHTTPRHPHPAPPSSDPIQQNPPTSSPGRQRADPASSDPTNSHPPPSSPSQASSPAPPKTPRLTALESRLQTLRSTLTTLQSTRATLAASTQLPSGLPLPPQSSDQQTLALALKTANGVIKEHIGLLHGYNEIKDIGQGIMGLVAEGRGCRVREIMEECGVGERD